MRSNQLSYPAIFHIKNRQAWKPPNGKIFIVAGPGIEPGTS